MKSLIFSAIIGNAIFSLTFASEHQPRAAWTIGQPVNTDSGTFRGHPASDAADVSEYLGIPYAMPPVGDLRWAPPQKYKYNGTGIRNATAFGFTCPTPGVVASGLETLVSNSPAVPVYETVYGQAFFANLAENGYNFSEDCLTLNVWTKPQTGDAKKAVMLFINGGTFNRGATSNYLYNGQYLANTQDVIIVTMNFRLNILGFPGTPTANGANNAGLLDQRLAVEWLRDNIAAFGGDPARITLFGQSSGATSVDIYSFAYPTDPIVHALVAESGVVLGTTPADLSVVTNYWFQTSEAVGCGNSTADPVEVLACMRTIDYNDLLNNIPAVPGDTGNDAYHPSVDNITIFKDYTSRGLAGKFAQIPFLLGHNNNEASLFVILDLSKGEAPNVTELGALESEFLCTTAARANLSASFDLPIWRYKYFGSWADTSLSPLVDSGAYHGSEVAQIWNTSKFPSVDNSLVPNATVLETTIATLMRGAWTTFAKDPVNGLLNYGPGWPMYVPASRQMAQFAVDNTTGVNPIDSALNEAGCGQVVSA